MSVVRSLFPCVCNSVCNFVTLFSHTSEFYHEYPLAERQLLPLFSYLGFDPRFQTGGYKTGHFNHLKSALFLYLVWKLGIHTVSKISYY